MTMTMKYSKTDYHHSLDELPICYISAFCDDVEIYRVQLYTSGQAVYVDRQNHPSRDDAWLDGTTFDEVMALNDDSDGEFVSTEISEAQFNHWWCVADNPKWHGEF